MFKVRKDSVSYNLAVQELFKPLTGCQKCYTVFNKPKYCASGTLR